MRACKGKYHRKNSNVCYVEKCAPHSHMEHGFDNRPEIWQNIFDFFSIILIIFFRFLRPVQNEICALINCVLNAAELSLAMGRGGAEVGGTGQRFGGAEGETLLKCTKSLIYAYVGSAKED